MSNESRDLLKNEIYPRLDAVQAGLLDSLEPRSRSRNAAYDMRCPSCNQRRAFYIVGSRMIRCNRESSCSTNLSIWDFVQQERGLSNGEVFKLLAESAGVTLEGSKPTSSPAHALAKQVRETCYKFLTENKQAMEYLTSRGMLDHAMETRDLGFYPGRAAMAKALKAAGCDLKLAEKWNIIPEYEKRGEHAMANRIVGYWEQPDGSIWLWGRTLGKPTGGTKKYHYSAGLSKTRPYGYRRTRGLLVGVEGPLDRESLEMMGQPACAIGGAHVLGAQAEYLAKDGCSRFVHVIDGDRAGWRGGVRSVLELERVGIDSLIAVVPTGADDVDTMRAEGREAAVHELIEGAMTGGEFLARMMLSMFDAGGDAFTDTVSEFYRIRAILGAASATGFDLTLQRAGVQAPTPDAHALRVAANLLEAGFSPDEAQKRVLDRYGVQLSTAGADR